LTGSTYSHREAGEKDCKSDEKIVWEWGSGGELKNCIKPISEKIGNNGCDKKDKEIQYQMAEAKSNWM
jgi:hypothetical protein